MREGAAALPPGDGPLFVVEQGSPEGLKEPKRITLKPFARVVTPARRGRARQSREWYFGLLALGHTCRRC